MLEDTERYGEIYGAGLSVAVGPEQSFSAGCRPDGNVCRAEIDRLEVAEGTEFDRLFY